MSCQYSIAYANLNLFDDDEARWRAVQTRDAVADGFFVYAVKTTKVYCRPICKARLARRSNVSFYSTGAEAQNAGFRACKRCRPEMEGFMPEERAVQRIRAFVLERAGAAAAGEKGLLSLSQMAGKSGLSKWHFHRVFKRTVGVTPFEYLRNERAAWGRSATGDGEGMWDAGQAAAFGLDDFNVWTVGSVGLETDGPGESPSVSSGLGLGLGLGLELDDLLVWPDEATG
ncbi:methylated-DNA-protein-cysteine methyltransferase [Metarhizium guizhouense ARSEF 977]|uniref:Methylated-DNA-protein-cysteine methyltransferase n=1 Tax=Metarhizium guizhouense (strain ARSEF 977) TaxID=1276136 RepID=A0A0B4H4J5_METGA|nr:methylated-DNA-protein-cysteine methyltransferase [Metarhizium guizhouense ARSEF 977]